jgi:putative LysE/RhtB family amino acid efflux pump
VLTAMRRAFLAAVAATASNPLTIISWGAIFAAASTAGATRTAAGALALLCGVALGSASWFAVLTGVVALARQRVRGAWLVAVDVVSGLGLVAFVGALGVRTVQDV